MDNLNDVKIDMMCSRLLDQVDAWAISRYLEGDDYQEMICFVVLTTNLDFVAHMEDYDCAALVSAAIERFIDIMKRRQEEENLFLPDSLYSLVVAVDDCLCGKSAIEDIDGFVNYINRRFRSTMEKLNILDYLPDGPEPLTANFIKQLKCARII